jgi:tetratricopeptide (TPR) repeat protein
MVFLKKFYIVLVLSIFSSLYSLPEQDNIFYQANDLYKQKQFLQAQECYAKLVDQTPQVLYNRGNCFYKQGLPGLALVYWRKAQRTWGLFNRGSLDHNIKLVAHEKSFLLSLSSYFRAFPLLWLQFLVLIFWSVLCLMFAQRKKFKKMFILVSFFCCISIFCLVAQVVFSHQEYGVVVSKKITFFSGPGETYQVLGELLEAQEVLIEKESGDFYKISLDSHVGWLSKKSIEKI